MGTAADQLIDEAAHKSTTDEFYWAIGEHMRACKGQANHLDELESAIQWCVDHQAIVLFSNGISTIQFSYRTSNTSSSTKVIRGEKFLDIVDNARDFMSRQP